MRACDVRMCVKHGADMIGFVVDYPRPVPWNLNVESAKALMAQVMQPAQTCVVTGGPREKIFHIAAETKPDCLQLHFGETLGDFLYLSDKLSSCGVKIIKTLFPDMPELEKTAKEFDKAGVYALLFDPRTPDNAVNSSVANLQAYVKLKRAVNCPVILAGGINPENAADMVNRTGAPFIDLMTGVEDSPGVKDESKVIALFQAMELL